MKQLDIKTKIHTIRGKQVMLDRDLAELYGVETRNLNKAVKRNPRRFPEDFCFQLQQIEFENLKFQFGTSRWGGTRKLPFAFTEHGVTALAGVLRSKIAEEISVKIVRSFVQMRRFLSQNASIFQKFQQVDQKLLEHDGNFDRIFKAIESRQLTPKQGIFFDGQIFDAHKFVADLINQAKQRIILIDNYIDDSVLALFSESQADVVIYTKHMPDKLQVALKKYNQQYKPITMKKFNRSHDRFLIIDNQLYHFGASLRDLGKKWFAFSRMSQEIVRVQEYL